MERRIFQYPFSSEGLGVGLIIYIEMAPYCVAKQNSSAPLCVFLPFWHNCHPLNPAWMQKWLALHHLSTFFLDIPLVLPAYHPKGRMPLVVFLYEANVKFLTVHPVSILWRHCAAEFNWSLVTKVPVSPIITYIYFTQHHDSWISQHEQESCAMSAVV